MWYNYYNYSLIFDMPKQITPDMHVGDPIHHWHIEEYEQHDRSGWWYLLMSVLAIGCFLYGIATNNFMFSLIIALVAIIFYLQHHQKPLSLDFKITDTGVIIGSKFYPYAELDVFYIVYAPPEVKTLFFETSSGLRPNIDIPLLNYDPVEIRETLLEFLTEDLEKEKEPLSKTFARNWRMH